MNSVAGWELPLRPLRLVEAEPEPRPQVETANRGIQFQPKNFLIIGAPSINQDQVVSWIKEQGCTPAIARSPVDAMLHLAMNPHWILCTYWLNHNIKTPDVIRWGIENEHLSTYQVFFFDHIHRHDLEGVQNLTMPELREMIKLMAAPDSTAH